VSETVAFGNRSDGASDKQRSRWSETALSTWSKIDTFLAGIFFTCILLVVQQRQEFENLVEVFGLKIKMLDLISFPLVITFLLFLFGALFFADACASLKRTVESLGIVFTFFGVLGSSLSLFFILFNINIAIALFAIIVGTILLLIWIGISFSIGRLSKKTH